ncbi:MAG: hypothetical protein EA409_02900 [Saprospirales bacterium]|nr:MAG: hypothetical protein EA409_02900 [Saprospirales bacterium]
MKTENSIVAAGLMSGSSLDGVDYAVLRFLPGNPGLGGATYKFEWIYSTSESYPDQIRQALSRSSHLSIGDYFKLQSSYSRFLGEFIASCHENIHPNLQPEVVGIHGHTVFHQPSEGFSTQMGDGAIIAHHSKTQVVLDFRNAPIAMGGQGAPMAPAIDALFYPGFDLFLNLGGIANLSIFSRDGIQAFDLCPCNQLLNHFAEESGLRFDPAGAIAAKGELNTDFLSSLESHPFLSKNPPKSLSNQEVTSWYLTSIDQSSPGAQDGLRTSCEFIARSIGHALQDFAKDCLQKRILVTGGGAHNQFMMARIKAYTDESGFQLTSGDPRLIDFKEALLLALMAARRKKSLPNFIFGNQHTRPNIITGGVYLPPNPNRDEAVE